MPRKFLFRSRNQHRLRPGFRPLELELLEARLPPGEAMLGFLLAAAWLEPTIAAVDTDPTPAARSRDSFSRESETSAAAESRSTATAEDSRGTSSHLLTPSGQGPLGILDDDSLWVWPSTIPSVPLKNLDSRDADRIFAASALSVGMPTGSGGLPEPSFVPDPDARTDRNVRPTLDTPASANLASGPAATDGHGPQLGQDALSSLGSTGAALAAAGLGRFGFVSHQRLRPGTSAVSETAAFAPDTLASRVFAAPGHHGHRPAHFLSTVNANDSTKPLLLHVHRPNRLDGTGITGSLSPTGLIGGKSHRNPAVLTKRIEVFRPQPVGTHPISHSRGGMLSGPVFTSRAGMTMTGPESMAPGTSAHGPANDGPDSLTQNDHRQGSFTFTLNLHGSDDQGLYALRSTGTGRYVSGDPSQPQVGTITITTQLHRGGGEVTSADPATTETLSFNPSGAGTLSGFDIDGYVASRYGIALATVTTYALDATGQDQFSDNDTQRDTAHPVPEETETDTLTFSDNGGDSYHLTVNGSGTSRAYELNLHANSNFRFTEDDNDQVSLSGESESDIYHEVDAGAEAVTDREAGTIGPDGAAQMTSFRLGDTANDTDTDTESSQVRKSRPQESGSENFLESETGSGNESVTITGSATAWTLTVDDNNAARIGEQEQGNGHLSGSLPTGGGTFQDDDQWNDSANGQATETLHARASGSGDDVNIQDLTYREVGNDGFDARDTDTEVDTLGQDSSTESESETGRGRNDFTLTITSPDGQAVTVNETETISDNFGDTDKGSDTWNDPYQPGNGPGAGTDIGSDSYNQSDNGNETTRLTSRWTVNAAGQFQLNTFDADLRGVGTTQGNDSGNGTLRVVGDMDRVDYTDNSTARNNYHIHLLNSGGPTTTVDIDETATGTEGDRETNTDNWSRGSNTGQDRDTQTDGDMATLSAQRSGTVDANGRYTQTNLTARFDGTDRFGNRDELDDDNQSGGTDDDVRQISDVSGTDEAHINWTQTPAGVALSDDESIRENFGINAMFTDTGTIQGSGAGHLSGPITANVHQRGRTQNGEFRFDPGNGDDSVNLTGDFDKTTTIITPGYSLSGERYLQDLSDVQTVGPEVVGATRAVISTEVSDPGLHVQESDSETNGQWSVGSIDYRAKPGVTITATVTYGIWAFYSGGEVTGTETVVDKQTEEETVSGSGRDHVALKTDKEHTDSGYVEGTLPSYHASLDFRFVDVTKHTIDGDEANPRDDHLQDTVTVHKETHSNLNTQKQVNRDPDITDESYQEIFEGTDDSTAQDMLTNGTAVMTAYSGTRQLTVTTVSVSSGPRGALTRRGVTVYTTTHLFRNGQVYNDYDDTSHYWIDGVDPHTGEEIHREGDGGETMGENPAPRDWFDAVSTFAAAVGDKVSGGLTQRIRQGLGYDDVVHYNSRAYSSGAVVGEVINVGVQNLTPCRFIGVVRTGVRVLHGVQAAAHVLDASESFQKYDVIGGLDALIAARSSFASMRASCFTAGTPLRTPDGAKPIEQFRPGDLILARDEFTLDGPVEAKTVEEVFIRQATVLNLHVGGRLIRTTAEHPFWVKDKGWRCAGELAPGDLLVAMETGQCVTVERVHDTGERETVYNVSVADYHTYFVGTPEWGWAAWAHNRAYLDIAPRYGPKKKGVIGYRNPKAAKARTKYARRSKLSGDHVLPQKGVNGALEQYFENNRQLGSAEKDAIREAVNEILHGRGNIRVMTRSLNSSKSNLNAAQFAKTPLGKDVDPSYIRYIDRIQKRVANKINDVLNKGQPEAQNWFKGFFAGT